MRTIMPYSNDQVFFHVNPPKGGKDFQGIDCHDHIGQSGGLSPSVVQDLHEK